MPFRKTVAMNMKNSGFTLIELMFSLVISSVLTMAVYQLLTWQSRTYFIEDQVIEMQQNTRSALNQLVREIRMGGHHAMGEVLTSNLTSWVHPKFVPAYPLPVTLDVNPKITLGPEGHPDAITFLSVLNADTNPTTLASGMDPGDTTLTLSLNATRTKSQYKPGDLIHIGSTSEYATVTTVSGKTLHFDTNPFIKGNQGVLYSYGTGDTVGEISVITYTVFNETNDPGHRYHTKNRPVLKKKVNRGGFQPVAENISDLSITTTGPGIIEMILKGKTAKPSPDDSLINIHKTVTVKTIVKIRNSSRIGMGTDCALAAAPKGFRIVDGLNAGLPCTIALEWDPVTGYNGIETQKPNCLVTGYRIYYDQIPGIHGFSTDIRNTTAHLLDVATLGACTIYTAVSSINSAGVSAKSVERMLTDTTAPERPSDLSARGSLKDNRIQLSWRTNQECDLAGYRIHRSTKRGGPYDIKINTLPLPASSTSYIDTGLMGCKTYYYVITAVDHCSNESTISLEANAKTIDNTAPLPPSAIRKSSLNGTDTVTWTLSVDDGNGQNDVLFYKLYGNGILIGEIDAGKSRFLCDNRSIISRYSVSAVDNCGNESEAVLEGDCFEIPFIVIDSPVSGTRLSGPALIRGTASAPKNRNLTEIQVKTNDGGWQAAAGTHAWIHPFDPSGFPKGTYILTARAADNTGCTATASTAVLIEHPDREIQTLSCKLLACWAGDNQPIYMKVYLHDFNHDPVSGALVSTNITLNDFIDIGNGWYGGKYPDNCKMNDALYARSDTAFSITDVPIQIDITAVAANTICRSITILNDFAMAGSLDPELKKLLSQKKK